MILSTNARSNFVKDNKSYISPQRLKHSIKMLYGMGDNGSHGLSHENRPAGEGDRF